MKKAIKHIYRKYEKIYNKYLIQEAMVSITKTEESI